LALLLAAAAPAHARQFDMVEATIAEAHDAMRDGTLTCRMLVRGYLDRIEAYDKAGPALNTVQTLNPRALDLADSLDAVRGSGQAMPSLHCVPVLLKDQVETSDMPTTFGSALFQEFVSARDATVVTKLRDAGALILAKTTMGEFATRYLGSAFGIVRNAYDPTRNPSGSSGGSGAGVAASFGLVGIGEDTGGSIRGPAAVNGLVGLRPTLPLVSRHGMLPANPTQDTMGPMTRSVTDAAVLLDVMAGYDPEDPITADAVGHVPDSYTDALDTEALRGARIGVLREPMSGRVDTASADFADVVAAIDRAMADLRALGAEVVDSIAIDSLSMLREIFNVYEVESAIDGYLADLEDPPVETLKDIVLSGAVVPSRARSLIDFVNRSTDDAGYLAVVTRRETLRRTVTGVMAALDLDAIVYPTFWNQPSTIPDGVLKQSRLDDGYGLGDNRGLSPAIGFPALTVPAGFTADGMPVGLEFLGRRFSEAMLLGFGYAYEQGTRHRRPPDATPPLGAQQ
jgi:Asp-tRNA(Asn)/Glu-tRNA(Gln) amidotransferase A subunit family amidase